MAHLGLDLQDLQHLQQEENNAEREDMSLQWSYIDMGSKAEKILCDVSTGKPRAWIPRGLRQEVFDAIHGLAHPSRRTTTRLITEKFIWKGIAKDTKD